MNLILAAALGILFAVGTYNTLQRDVIKLIIGLSFQTTAVNLLLVATGRTVGERAPFVARGQGQMADPVGQALVLTAVVIGFGTTAFLLSLVLRMNREGLSFDTSDLQNLKE